MAQMNELLSTLRVNSERFRANFEALAKIGATPEGGVHRPALSEAHLMARRWFLERAGQMGLDVGVDQAGNHSAVLRCGRVGGPTLLLGSHLDSVPNGGRFDGALGVLAALEALQLVKEQGIRLSTHLEAIDFTDEEARFVSLLGSLALTGQLEPEHLQTPREGRDRFQEALREAGMSESSLASARRDPATVAGYVELHIEQGMRLMDSGAKIGIVTGIVGIRTYKIRFIGRADHAGTRPMDKRLDAAQGASAFALATRQLVMTDFPGQVANVGHMRFEPGAFNVVPQVVTVALEFRASDADTLDEMETALLERASVEARRFGLGLEAEHLDSTAPTSMSNQVQEAIADASKALGLKHAYMPSGAGHDGQAMASICPTGMVFVPSVGGFSHSSKEFTAWEDCVNGANVLLQAALRLAQ
jgi:N-carbamoyl-L-amino-acid hydrolase